VAQIGQRYLMALIASRVAWDMTGLPAAPIEDIRQGAAAVFIEMAKQGVQPADEANYLNRFKAACDEAGLDQLPF